MTTTLRERGELKADGPKSPEPPNDGGGDPWGDDPEGIPSLETYLSWPPSMQIALYSKVLRRRILRQRLHLREVAEETAELSAHVQGRSATEKDIGYEMAFLTEHQKRALREADEWLANPSKFRVSMTLAPLYSEEYLSGDDERAHWFIDLSERLARSEEQR